MELRHTVRLVNPKGLHARPCHAIASLSSEFQSDVELRVRSRRANAKSILSLMTLGAYLDDEIEVVARGPDARGAVDALVALIGRGFDEL